ncbi:MAG: copper amine oxidase N-terminal domain-containing protein [Oscillospiraceae bacterium]|nr:copper amine oxidase N-terminal domain-containing protein [Oscillospiraceae bacterium]
MKKGISILIAIVLIVSASCMTGAAAVSETESETESGTIGSDVLTVKYNGEAVVFPDAQPFIDENNRTLIPVRFVAETMGADVSWVQETQTAVIEQNGITIVVPIGSDTISVTKDGSTATVTMDTEAVLLDDRT